FSVLSVFFTRGCRQHDFTCPKIQPGIIVLRMAGPRDGLVRQPAVAGMFYPRDPDECRAQASEMLSTDAHEEVASAGSARLVGAIVPHAGWICSGKIAGESIA